MSYISTAMNAVSDVISKSQDIIEKVTTTHRQIKNSWDEVMGTIDKFAQVIPIPDKLKEKGVKGKDLLDGGFTSAISKASGIVDSFSSAINGLSGESVLKVVNSLQWTVDSDTFVRYNNILENLELMRKAKTGQSSKKQ